MSVNKFGSSGKSAIATDTSKKYVDDKFKTLSANLAMKANKSADGDLNMNQHSIKNVCNPQDPSDAATKKYVEQFLSQKETKRYVKNTVGYISELWSNSSNKNGVCVKASNEQILHEAYLAFCNSRPNHWLPSRASNCWLKIEFLIPILIYRFAVRGNYSNLDRILKWKLEGSNDDNIWDTLYHDIGGYRIDNSVSYFNVNTSTAYRLFRFYIIQSESTASTVTFFQLYTLDEIV